MLRSRLSSLKCPGQASTQVRHFGVFSNRAPRRALPRLLTPLAVPIPSRLQLVRGYAQGPGGGQSGFPGFAGFKPQHQKGEALKEYVSLYLLFEDRNADIPQSVDLTQLAKDGKLDPVIGRDEGEYSTGQITLCLACDLKYPLYHRPGGFGISPETVRWLPFHRAML